MAETRKQTAKKSTVKKAPAKKSAAKRSSAKRAPAKRSAVKKSSGPDDPTNESAESSSPDESSEDRRAAATTESDGRGHRSSSDGARKRTSPMRVAAVALEQLAALTGRPSEGVVGIERDEDEWVVEIEVLELRRIPNTTDVLARYRVTADDSGEVTGYHRMQRYVRGAAGEE
jgi:hypothetical protein